MRKNRYEFFVMHNGRGWQWKITKGASSWTGITYDTKDGATRGMYRKREMLDHKDWVKV